MSIPGIDSEPVTAWLDENIEEIEGPYDFSLIEGGRSNLTYMVTDRHGRRFVLRRPPLGHVLATAHDMAREHKIISAVGTTDVPVPRTLGLCSDDAVNQAPFYVMDFVDGIVLDSPDKGAELSIEQRNGVSGSSSGMPARASCTITSECRPPLLPRTIKRRRCCPTVKHSS